MITWKRLTLTLRILCSSNTDVHTGSKNTTSVGLREYAEWPSLGERSQFSKSKMRYYSPNKGKMFSDAKDLRSNETVGVDVGVTLINTCEGWGTSIDNEP